MKGRSPNYPGVNLEEAIELTNMLYNGGSEFRTPQITQIWKMNGTSGTVRMRTASLCQYMLLHKTKGVFRIGSRYSSLISLTKYSPNYNQVLRNIALCPPLFDYVRNVLLNASLSFDLRQHLIDHKGFTRKGVDIFIQNYNNTMFFAGIDKDQKDDIEMIDLPLPFSPALGNLKIPAKMSEEDWSFLTSLIALYRSKNAE